METDDWSVGRPIAFPSGREGNSQRDAAWKAPVGGENIQWVEGKRENDEAQGRKASRGSRSKKKAQPRMDPEVD